jgi:tagaturonate epimerase
MKFGKLDLDPARSPGVLDTTTWDPESAWRIFANLDPGFWLGLADVVASGRPLPKAEGITFYLQTRHDGCDYLLAGLADGQRAFLRLGPAQAVETLGAPAAASALPGDIALTMYPADAAVLDRFFRYVDPTRGPRALGAVPRLGIGTRMTTLVWPGIWDAMVRGGFAANAIQNSVRELNLLPNLLAGLPAEQNIAFNFGTIETGYTGSTFEGLWVAGVMDALCATQFPTAGYGADADHIQVKRGAAGLERALRLVNASRYYTFYTLDVSDVLDYIALLDTSQAAVDARFERLIPEAEQRRALLADYTRPQQIAGRECRMDAPTVARLVAKHWDALAAVEVLTSHIVGLKDGARFDLELSIDEHPGEVATFACLTGEQELVFLLREARRRGIPLTHVAPNYGVEKGVDYSCPDGLSGLSRRAARLGQIAEEFGVMADFHSGDDLSQATRQSIRAATGGRLHFKVSPMVQLLFGEVLADYHPDLFRRWWEDARDYARREAAAGSTFAAACLNAGDGSPRDAIFHHFSFAFVGRRNADGQFLYREEFYNLSPAFRAAYAARITQYMLGLVEDLF